MPVIVTNKKRIVYQQGHPKVPYATSDYRPSISKQFRCHPFGGPGNALVLVNPWSGRILESPNPVKR